MRIETPRDRKGSFEPQIVRKGQRRFEGFDDKILALYSRGLSTRDIEAQLAEIYGVKVGRDLISRVTDAVMDDVREWQQRPLDDVYPVVFLDALVLKIRRAARCNAGPACGCRKLDRVLCRVPARLLRVLGGAAGVAPRPRQRSTRAPSEASTSRGG